MPQAITNALIASASDNLDGFFVNTDNTLPVGEEALRTFLNEIPQNALLPALKRVHADSRLTEEIVGLHGSTVVTQIVAAAGDASPATLPEATGTLLTGDDGLISHMTTISDLVTLRQKFSTAETLVGEIDDKLLGSSGDGTGDGLIGNAGLDDIPALLDIYNFDIGTGESAPLASAVRSLLTGATDLIGSMSISQLVTVRKGLAPSDAVIVEIDTRLLGASDVEGDHGLIGSAVVGDITALLEIYDFDVEGSSTPLSDAVSTKLTGGTGVVGLINIMDIENLVTVRQRLAAGDGAIVEIDARLLPGTGADSSTPGLIGSATRDDIEHIVAINNISDDDEFTTLLKEAAETRFGELIPTDATTVTVGELEALLQRLVTETEIEAIEAVTKKILEDRPESEFPTILAVLTTEHSRILLKIRGELAGDDDAIAAIDDKFSDSDMGLGATTADDIESLLEIYADHTPESSSGQPVTEDALALSAKAQVNDLVFNMDSEELTALNTSLSSDVNRVTLLNALSLDGRKAFSRVLDDDLTSLKQATLDGQSTNANTTEVTEFLVAVETARDWHDLPECAEGAENLDSCLSADELRVDITADGDVADLIKQAFQDAFSLEQTGEEINLVFSQTEDAEQMKLIMKFMSARIDEMQEFVGNVRSDDATELNELAILPLFTEMRQACIVEDIADNHVDCEAVNWGLFYYLLEREAQAAEIEFDTIMFADLLPNDELNEESLNMWTAQMKAIAAKKDVPIEGNDCCCGC